MIVATFTANGQTSETEEGGNLGRFATGQESKLACQVSRSSGSSNFSVQVQAGFPDNGGTNWGTLMTITQTDDGIPKFVDFGFGLSYRLRCETRGSGNTLRAILA